MSKDSASRASHLERHSPVMVPALLIKRIGDPSWISVIMPPGKNLVPFFSQEGHTAYQPDARKKAPSEKELNT